MSVADIADARQLEMLNVFIGVGLVRGLTDISTSKRIDMPSTICQAILWDSEPLSGPADDSMAETETGILSTISRQTLRTHRPFRSIIMDKHGNPVLWVRWLRI